MIQPETSNRWIGYTGRLQVEHLSWYPQLRSRVLREFCARGPNGEIVRVPIGCETDYASIPRFIWRLFAPWDYYAEAAVLHDYLYGGGIIEIIEGAHHTRRTVTRAEADKLFLFWMRKTPLPAISGDGWRASVRRWRMRKLAPIRRTAIYWAVRVFGGRHFKRDSMLHPCNTIGRGEG